MVMVILTIQYSVSQDQKYMMCVIDGTIISIFEISESEKTVEG